MYFSEPKITGHWIHSKSEGFSQAEHACSQLLSLSAGLPLKPTLAMRGILYAWSGLSLLFHTLVQEGVGDTPDSYAYDGNRVRKWNVTTTNYGKVSSCLPRKRM